MLRRSALLRCSTLLVVLLALAGSTLTGCASMEPVGTERAESFHGANVVFVDSPASPAEALEAATSRLALRGWAMGEATPTTLTTGWKEDGTNRYRLIIAAVPQGAGSRLGIRGEVSNSGLGVTQEVRRTGQSGSIARRAWDAIETSARGLGTVTSYARL